MSAVPVEGTTEPFLVFGYGSLIWKPPPHVKKRIPGYINGYVRRFWQASEDHRGTVEAPGRVVTLISKEDLKALNLQHEWKDEPCWGAVYEINPESVEEVKQYLDIREINGYSLTTVTFHPAVKCDYGPTFKVSVFIGTVDNPQFTPGTIEEIAEIIGERIGPSGPNKEYLINLAVSLRDLHGDKDEHVEALLKRLESQK